MPNVHGLFLLLDFSFDQELLLVKIPSSNGLLNLDEFGQPLPAAPTSFFIFFPLALLKIPRLIERKEVIL